MVKSSCTKISLSVLFILLINIIMLGQDEGNTRQNNFVVIKPGESAEEIIKQAANVTPSQNQYEWQKQELTGFVHFGINTFDRVEWGRKDIDISKYNPKKLDARQWVKAFKEAGMKSIIMVAKHHDGFCQWPTKYTTLNISNTPYLNGKGDIVRDLSKACREAGLKFGIYLSPWDMHEKSYGTPEYNVFFRNLLTELLTKYGEISEVWFDGACGEGPNGKKQVYDWHSYYQVIRKLQPKAVIAIMGPDVRWVGTESGYGRKTEWSVLPGTNMNQDAIAANSQQTAVDGAFVPHDLMDEDLGSRQKIEKASSLIWYPAEVDVSIRPRWFYNSDDDNLVKSPDKLVDIYYNSVGLNDVLLLNVPPDTNGLITKYDINSLKGMRYILDETFKTNLAEHASVKASNEVKGREAKYILDNKLNTYWTTGNGVSTAEIEIDLKKIQLLNRAMLQENILAGQRIEKFHIEWWNNGKWDMMTEGTTIGYKRLLRFPAVKTNKVKLVIDECRTNPTLASFGLYLAPPEVSIESGSKSFTDSASVKLTSNLSDAKIYYTLDDKTPDRNSKLYSHELFINKTARLTAVAVTSDGKKGLPVSAEFNKAEYEIRYITPYDEKYPGEGKYTLIDGDKGNTNFNNGKWQGFHGTDLDVIVDLKEVKKISKISAGFLKDIDSFIFLPESVEFSVSEDGKDFTTVKELKNNSLDNKDNKAARESFGIDLNKVSARYIQIKAANIGTCPAWHKGAGDKAWLFADEITIK